MKTLSLILLLSISFAGITQNSQQIKVGEQLDPFFITHIENMEKMSNNNLSESSNLIKKTTLKAAPRANAENLLILPKNASVTITTKVKGWAKIKYTGEIEGKFETIIGWVPKENLVE